MKSARKSIAVLICYQGKLPWYFDYFVYSCVYNPSVDFFIVSDDSSYKRELPRNVRLVYATLDDIRSEATRKLGFAVSIPYAYKLCDLKPAYGVIFSDLLNGYAFWAHGDIDVIFGNLRRFLTGPLLEKYDLISVRPDWTPGCFLLFRNCEKMNTLFLRSRDYRRVYTSDKYYNFDEAAFGQKAFTDGLSFDEVATETESMTHLVKKTAMAGIIKAYFDLHIIEGTPGRLHWERGRLTYRGRYEVMLYHLIHFKKIYTPEGRGLPTTDKFDISPTRIYHRRNATIPA